jgi:hypothetical protein
VRTTLTVAAALAAATVVLHSAQATTIPGRLYISDLAITDTSVKVHVRRDLWASTLHYPRGAEVRYQIVNRGTRAYSLDILGSVTGRLLPGKRTSILVYWGRRGDFVFRASPRGARLRVIVA